MPDKVPNPNIFQLRPIAALIAALSLGACTSTVDQGAAFSQVRNTLGDRVGHEAAWRNDPKTEAAVASQIDTLLAQELSLETATHVALLNNRALQARYADIGIANADLVQAGLLSNPVLDVMARPTTNPAEGAILEFGLAQSVLDIFMRPARQKAAKAEFDKTTSDVAAAVVQTIGEVREAYIEALSARNAVAAMKEIAAAAEASWELAQRFHKAGNISDLQLAEEQAMHEDVGMMVEQTDLQAAETMQSLAAILTVSSDALKLPDQLPALPSTEPAAPNEASALDRRLDVAAARASVVAHMEKLKLTTDWRLWKEIELKISAEREPDKQWAIGPGLALALPLFDQGGPAVARAGAELLKAENELKDLESHARAEIRKATSKAAAMRRVAERYRTTVLPLKQNIVRLKQQEYNYMLIGVFDVLMAKREETQSYLGYIETVRDYWLARAALATATGGGAVNTPSLNAGAQP